MQLTGDVFEIVYYVIDHCFYWKTKEKTLIMLNSCLFGFFISLPLAVVPIRYIFVGALWTTVSLSSPFFIAMRQAFIQIILEYAIVIERVLPFYMTKINQQALPQIVVVLKWIPVISRYFTANGKANAQNIIEDNNLNN